MEHEKKYEFKHHVHHMKEHEAGGHVHHHHLYKEHAAGHTVHHEHVEKMCHGGMAHGGHVKHEKC